MIDLGIIKPGTTIYVPFGSYAGSTGASAAMTGLATSDILVYKDGSTTERASTSGFTLLDTDGLDFDGKTGINGVSIDLADNTTAGFWAAGSRYWVVIGDVTVDSQTVRFIAATFTIGLPAAVLNTTIATLASQTSFTLTAGPAEDDALNGCLLYIHDVASAVQGGFALVSDYTGSTKTVTLAAGTTFPATASDNVMVMPPRLLPTVAGRTLNVGTSGHALADLDTIKTQTITCAAGVTVLASVGTAATSTAQTGDAFARLGAPAGASVSADVAAIKTDTGNLVTRITSTLFSGITSLAQWLGMIAGKQTGDTTARTEIRATGAGSGTFDETTDSVQAIRDRGDAAWITASPPSAAAIADAVWDETLADHLTAGSTGAGLNAAGSAGDPWATTLPGAYGAGTAGKIVGDNLNATISSVKAKTDLIPAGGFPSNFSSTSISASGLVALTPADHIAIADAILARDIGSGTNALTALDERTVRSALRFIRNKWTVSSGTLTVKTENDSTTAWTSAVTGTAGADPVTANDPT